MFHDGEQIGLGSAVYFFGQKPYQDIFFIHGAFFDPLIGHYSFKLFGPSIGSFYLADWLIIIVGFLALLVLLSIVIKNEVLFYLSALFFYGSIETRFLGWDFPVFLYILIAFLIIEKRLNAKLGFFLTSFLSFFTFYFSVGRGFFLFTANIIFFLIYVFIKEKLWNVRPATLPKIAFKNLPVFISFILGTLTAILIGIIYFGIGPFKEFINITFVNIPKITPLLFDYKYPQFSIKQLFPYWWPIIVITANLSFLLYYFIYKRGAIKTYFIFPILTSILAVIFYKTALGRNDPIHIFKVSHLVFLASFVILDFILKGEQNRTKKIAVYSLMLLFFFLPFFNYERVINPPSYAKEDVKTFLSLPKTDDNFWLTKEQKDVRNFILKNTKEEDYVFVFTNESAYYYLFKRRNPTRFYTIWFAAPSFYQKEVIEDLNRNKPKYIIYQSKFWSSNLPDPKEVNEWILENYTQGTTIGNTEILKSSKF